MCSLKIEVYNECYTLWSTYSLEDPITFTVHVICLATANLKPKYDIQQLFFFFFESKG